MALLLICVFIFGVFGNSTFGGGCPRHFGSIETSTVPSQIFCNSGLEDCMYLFSSAMFSLFICMTQDGWLRIVDELDQCGHDILGPIYLVVFITIGAFIFANLVVAVVVTNLVQILLVAIVLSIPHA